MKLLQKGQEPSPKPEVKPAREEEARKAALRIEELEARLAPQALWAD